MNTVEKFIVAMDDELILNIYDEVVTGIVPATGYAHGACRKINRMIDKGQLCINQTTYRKVYLPTLAKLVYKELARRYAFTRLTGHL